MIGKYLQKVVHQAITKLGVNLDLAAIVIETSKDTAHGDYATNVAMQLSKTLRKAPRDVATLLISQIDQSSFEKIEIAGPGFINFFVKPSLITSFIGLINEEGHNFGNGETKNISINIEFVSANPTGKLHLGHGRGAALGDSLARILTKDGYHITKEFYVNDAGVQINNLGKSLYTRYLNLLGIKKEMPEDGYFGTDLITVAQSLKAQIGDKYKVESSEGLEYFKLHGSQILLEIIKQDLKQFNVVFDVFSYETEVKENDAIAKLLEKLAPYTYIEEGATFLKTTAFGDDKDRVIIKSNGENTYFLPDIAYHLDKLSRGSDLLIDVLGADHHGYIGRMKAALQMFGYSDKSLEVEIIQMVRIIKDGEELKMSKRTGNAITLEELMEDVGVDAARYFFIAKSASTHFDFDLDLAAQKSNANPVFYAQYAHARLSTVIAKGQSLYGISYKGEKLTAEHELNLLKQLIAYPSAVADASLSREPYKIANYIQKLASLIHTFYTESRILDETNVELTQNRLGLCSVSALIIKDALALLGVSAPTSM